MKKLNALSYRSKKRRIDEELQSHLSNFSSLECSSTINNSINHNTDRQITENYPENLVVSNNYDLLPENNVSTNNAFLNIQTYNQNRMDSILNDVVLTNERSVLNQDSLNTASDDNDYSLMLPLHNEDELSEFENKLQNKSFRLNVVNGLKRLVKDSLTSTIRQILRNIFDDEVLQIFSYVGQKKKKIFSSLASCAIIFEAVRSMKRFQDVPNADIETPIKIYIAGAAFRKKK